MGTSENPVWLGEYVWEETSFDGSEPKTGPLPDEVLGMFRPQHCLLCNIKTANMHVAYAHYESKGHFKKVAHYMKFNYNAIGNLKSKEGKFEPVTCDVCNIELLTRMVYLQHYEGKQHAKNLKKKALNTPVNVFPVENPVPVPIEPAADAGESGEELLKSLPPPPPLPKLGDYVCALCDVTTATRAQMEMHNNGARHLRNVAKLAEGELREFYMRNGNCEPVETGSADPTSTTTPSATPGPSQAAPYPQNPGYTPVNQPMMPQYPQMPYGSYPYPIPYDYNAWCQMYGQQYAAYYSQYGQYPYGAYGQQYTGQPPYNPGQQGQPPYNPGQQAQPPYNQGQGQPTYNPGQQGQPPYNPEQQGQPPYNAGQQAQPPHNPGQQGQPSYNPGQQYPANSGPPGNNDLENQDPSAWSGDSAQYYGNAETPRADGETKPDNTPVPPKEEKTEENVVPGHSENDGVIDSTIFRKYSTNRRTVRTPPKASEVRVSPLPEGFDKKPLAVLPSVSQNEEKSEERGPDEGVHNGIDFESSSEKSQSDDNSKAVESTQQPSCTAPSPAREPELPQRLSANVQSSNGAAGLLEPARIDSPPVECHPGESASNGEKEESTKTAEDSTGTSETQVICLDSDSVPETLVNPKEPTWRSNSPSIPLLGEIPAGIQISDKLVSECDDLPSIATQDPFPFNQINSNEPPPPGCSEETKLPSKPDEPIPKVQNEAEPRSHPTVADSTPPPPFPSPASATSYYPASTLGAPTPQESVRPYYSAPVHNAPSYYPAPPNGAYNYTPTVSAPPSTYNYTNSQYPVHQPPNYSAPVPFMTPTPEYSVPATSMQMSTNYSVPVASMPAVSIQSAQPTSLPAVSAPPTINPPSQLHLEPQNSKPQPPQPPADYSAPASSPVPTPPPEPPSETVPDPPPPDTSAPPPEPETETSQEASTPDKTVPAKPKLSSFFARAAVKMIKEKKNQQETQSGPSNQGDELKKPEDAVLPVKGKTISIPTIKGTSLESGSTTEDIVASGFGAEKEAVLPSSATKSDNESASRNKSVERKKKKSSRKSRSRSRSSSRSSRTPRRHRRRRSSSRSLSPDRSPRRYDDHRRYGGYRGGYGYGRRGRGFYRYRGNFRNRNDWDRDDSYSRYDRYDRNDRDEFGRERSWKRDERDKRRRSRRRRSRSRSRSSSASPPRVEDVGYWEMKTRAPTSPSPENEEPEPQPENSEMSPKVEKVILEENKPSVAANPVIEKMKEKISFELDKDEIVLSKTQGTPQMEESPGSSAGNIKREDSPPGMNSDEEEREKREILEKVALIKRKLMETQDEDEKPHKTKKRKKDKAKKKKKRKKRSSSSSSDSSSDSSISSTSSSSSSSSETSTSSEPKSKRLVDALMAQLSGESEDKSTSHRRSSKRSRKASKRESSKKKKKKDKKRKKEKKKKKEEPESLSTYITANGLYHCKYCNFTSVAGGSFLEHLISEEHKLLLKLIKSKVNQ